MIRRWLAKRLEWLHAEWHGSMVVEVDTATGYAFSTVDDVGNWSYNRPLGEYPPLGD